MKIPYIGTYSKKPIADASLEKPEIYIPRNTLIIPGGFLDIDADDPLVDADANVPAGYGFTRPYKNSLGTSFKTPQIGVEKLPFLYNYVQKTNPSRTEVYTLEGNLVAIFTMDSRTAHLFRTPRTFTEQKPAFTDLFKRVRSNGWGPSPSGGTWGVFGGPTSDYLIADNKGKITPSATNSSRYVRLDDVVKEADARTRFKLTTVPAGASNSAALMLGFQTTSNHMRLRLTIAPSGNITASISEVVGGDDTVLSSAGVIHTGYAANDEWWIRGVYNGDKTYSMYAWKDGDSEPSSPTVTYTYPVGATFSIGKLGARVFLSTGATNAPTFEFTHFSSTTYTKWPVAPTVTHNIWVRIQPEVFTGIIPHSWLTQQLMNDTQDDVLATVMQYVSNAPPVMDGSLQIAGDAEYGPLYNTDRSFDLAHASDGTRQEGSDWNDYLGINGSIRYTHLVTPKSDSPESHQFRSVDCSGLDRMVFGYRGGMPMCLDDVEDFDGINIPRRATQQQTDGPGNYLIPHTGSTPPTDYSMLLPGDIVFFDADTSNPDEQEGQVDHLGIFMGVDDNDGGDRFGSSRKTISGATISDMGGNSKLNGNGLYAKTFRAARRY